MLRFLTAGESHGPALTVIIEGLPAGMPFFKDAIDRQLARRQSSYGRGPRMQIEKDRAEILSGVRNGLTLGTPLAMLIHNLDWENWKEIMSPYPEDLEKSKVEEKSVARPRPGHADLAGGIKYRFSDLRNVLERASARETAARVAVGAVAGILLERLGCRIFSHVLQIGEVQADTQARNCLELERDSQTSPLSCADPKAAQKMLAAISQAKEQGDTLGGVFEVVALGLPPGLGSHVEWDRRLDGQLAAAVMSIPGIKGVELGLGFRGSSVAGSNYHDPIFYESGKGYYRSTNNAGGLEGGITNGEPLVLRAVIKPIPTLRKPLASVDIHTKEPVAAAFERSDVSVVPAAAVVGEAMVAWVLAQAILEKFGGDSLEEIAGRWQEHIQYVSNFYEA